MTPSILYYHKRDLTEADRKVIELAKVTRLHARTGNMIAQYRALEFLRDRAELEREREGGGA